MGMYDYIICRAELPGNPPDFVKADGWQFQSKSLGCDMSVYEITSDRRLQHVRATFGEDVGKFIDGTFSLDFYDGNSCASWGKFRFTRDGEDSEWVEYRAEFVDGILKTITETERTREPGLSRAVYEKGHELSESEPVINLTEPEIGARMYMQWGGSAKGYPVTLIAKTARKWAISTDDDLEAIHACHFGNLLFHSEADAKIAKGARGDGIERAFAFYRAQLQERAALPQPPETGK